VFDPVSFSVEVSVKLTACPLEYARFAHPFAPAGVSHRHVHRAQERHEDASSLVRQQPLASVRQD
jgi:hypothetical protein